ncbi:MAG: flavodoxin family protein [Oscillospiraceae bacterium]|nr:flavodoxin family protein [Oscillospiraceae bacterium]
MEKSKKMLAILASPRKDGNVAKMLEIAVEKACETGNFETVNFVNLYEKNITWCKGCMGCKTQCSCVIEDDIKEIERLLKECDLVAIACPTYFANISAPLKNMFDRLVGVVFDDNDSFIPKPKLSKKQKYFILVTCSTPFPFDRIAGQSTGVVRAIREFFHVSGMRKAGAVIFAGTRNKSEIPRKIIGKINSIIEGC